MALATVNVQITPKGEILAEVNGVVGPACDKIIAAIAQGQQIVSQVAKPEYKLQSQNQVKK